jgi:Bacterial Ig-like domain (group 3)
LTITRATPTVSVSDPGGAYTGSPFAAQATVTGINGTPAPSLEGVFPTLTYYVGSSTSGTNFGAEAPSAAGTYTVVANYPGSEDYTPAQSKPATFSISQQGTVTTSVTPAVSLIASGSATVYGQSITFVATVGSGAGVAGGSVTFADGATALATVPVNGSGQATLTTTTLAVGPHSVSATYSGAGEFNGSQSGTAPESVTRDVTSIMLVPHPTLKKKKLKAAGLAAEIEPAAPGGGVPTGVVTFELIQKHRKKTKVKTLGTAALTGGEVTLTFKPNKLLHQMLTVIYTGDGNFQANTMSTPKLTKKALL